MVNLLEEGIKMTHFCSKDSICFSLILTVKHNFVQFNNTQLY